MNGPEMEDDSASLVEGRSADEMFGEPESRPKRKRRSASTCKPASSSSAGSEKTPAEDAELQAQEDEERSGTHGNVSPNLEKSDDPELLAKRRSTDEMRGEQHEQSETKKKSSDGSPRKPASSSAAAASSSSQPLAEE
eukprot:719127-Karenia_brevis.AAC.1